jgi:tetratricopeptide (TPR) repeat protein
MTALRAFIHISVIWGALVVLPNAAGQAASAVSQPGGAAPDPVSRQLRAAQQFVAAGRLDEARRETQAALKLHGTDERLYNLLGVIEAQQNNYVAAESNLRHAIKLAPRFPAPYLNLGRVYQEHSNTDEHATQKALHVYAQLLSVVPDSIEGNYQASRLSNMLGAYDASLQYLDQLPDEVQARTGALVLRCANAAALGKAEDARKAAKTLLSRDDLDVETMLPIWAAISLHKANDFAVEFLKACIQKNLFSVVALQHLADLYESQNKFADAEEALEQSLQITGASSPVLLQLARISYRAGDRDKTLGYLAHDVELEPTSAAAHFFFGMVCVELNLLPHAKKHLEEVVRLDPNRADYNYALGSVLVQASEFDEAIKRFKKAKELQPGDAHARFALGVAYYYSFQNDEAKAELEAIAQKPETAAGAQLFLGRIALKSRNFDEAEKYLHASIAADASISESYEELGELYLEKKDYVDAEKVLLQATKLAPESYLASHRLQTVYLRTKNPKAEEQAQRTEQLRKAGQEKERLLMRRVEIDPH